MIRIYTQSARGERWIQQYQGQLPLFACVLGFTATGLIPGISAAGATPEARQYTAIADAEFLVNGITPKPQYPLPTLDVGISPVLISRAVVEALNLPVYLFNAGLPHPPSVAAINLGGTPANCLSTGKALPLTTVQHLFEQGLLWGERLAKEATGSYVILAECVVGGTTTALSLLTGLGIAATGKVNSSHPHCNHAQKWEIVQQGLQQAGWAEEQGGRGAGGQGSRGAGENVETRHVASGNKVTGETEKLQKQYPMPNAPCPMPNSQFPIPNPKSKIQNPKSKIPMSLVAAVGDPMQIAVAGMAIAASRYGGVLLAGGTQMLAVYALARAIANADSLPWQPEQVAVGTTRWVAEDPTGDTVGLAQEIGDVPLLATDLSFRESRYPQLRVYEQGYVKEGVGAGGCAIAASVAWDWHSVQLLRAVEALVERYGRL